MIKSSPIVDLEKSGLQTSVDRTLWNNPTGYITAIYTEHKLLVTWELFSSITTLTVVFTTDVLVFPPMP